MNKFLGLCSLALIAAANSRAAEPDTAVHRALELQEVMVSAVRAQRDAPFAVTNIKGADVQDFARSGKELPILFAQTPGVLAWGENGLGTGSVYMRIRGAGDSRINVTLDGVPLNSPEDQAVFWANMNSYGALLGSVQIQRGVGTSTNGDGAFGGTIALATKAPSLSPKLELNYSFGSYNTQNYGGSFSTGLLGEHVVVDAAFHATHTDGYVNGTEGNSGSYYAGFQWENDNLVIRYKNLGNYETTGQAWNGVTAGNDDMSLMDGTYGMTTGVKTYGDLYKLGLGKYNSLYEQLRTDDDGNFVTTTSGSYLTSRYTMSDGTYWDRATDNFWQDHNILSAALALGEHWTTNAALHYTYGYGYYNEFRPNNKLSKFGLSNYTLSDGSTLKRTDFVRKKGMYQNTFGLIWNANYKDDRWDVIGGISLQQFNADHFGRITYIANEELAAELLSDGSYKYYSSDADKDDYSAFVKAAYKITANWNVFLDAQYRHVDYRITGVNDRFYENAGLYTNQELDIDKKYDFFNPKGGFSFRSGGHYAYGSVAWSHREPERNNFTDNGSYPAPKAEQLLDYEVGYQYTGDGWWVGANCYYMDYINQFVQTGEVSDIGESLTTNIKDSYRLGVELNAGWDITPWLAIEANAALSSNKIKDFDEVVEDWDSETGYQTIHYDNSTLAFSPSLILNGFLRFHYKSLQAIWHTNYVSRQYLDNTECKDRSLPGFCVNNVHLTYSLPAQKNLLGVKEVLLGVDLNNVFNHHYASSGWVYSAIYESGGHPNDNRYYQIGFIPSAGFTAMGSIALRF